MTNFTNSAAFRTLSYTNEQVREQLEEIWQHNEELNENYQTNGTPPEAKWNAITKKYRNGIKML